MGNEFSDSENWKDLLWDYSYLSIRGSNNWGYTYYWSNGWLAKLVGILSPFRNISDPAILRAMVQDGVECEECGGTGWKSTTIGATLWGDSVDREIAGMPRSTPTKVPCPTCNGTGHIPLSNPDLDALAAKWCEGWERHPYTKFWDDVSNKTWHEHPPAYTTSPDAAMRLQEKYKFDVLWLELTSQWAVGYHLRLHGVISEQLLAAHKDWCRAITTAALIAALTEAINE